MQPYISRVLHWQRAVPMTNLDTLSQVVALCERAGDAILAIYHSGEDIGVQIKTDASPLTRADLASNTILQTALALLTPNVPVLSEESNFPDFDVRKHWFRYWLVDPLDGTKEFIARNGEFTVNVALIEAHRPVMGVVYAPVQRRFYCGLAGHGAWKIDGGIRSAIHCRSLTERLHKNLSIDIVASRRHNSGPAKKILSRVSDKLPTQIKTIGSSLKFCLVAEGLADLYPRLSPTCEWDTAAGQAVVEAAGGAVLDTCLQAVRYNTKAELLNPHFIVVGEPHYAWQPLLKMP